MKEYFSHAEQVSEIEQLAAVYNEILAASDEYGTVSLTMFPKTYKEYNDINKKNIIRIFGRVEKRFDKYQIIVNSLKILK